MVQRIFQLVVFAHVVQHVLVNSLVLLQLVLELDLLLQLNVSHAAVLDFRDVVAVFARVVAVVAEDLLQPLLGRLVGLHRAVGLALDDLELSPDALDLVAELLVQVELLLELALQRLEGDNVLLVLEFLELGLENVGLVNLGRVGRNHQRLVGLAVAELEVGSHERCLFQH